MVQDWDGKPEGVQPRVPLGLFCDNARWYDPALSHFIMADTIIPGAGNPQAWDRYAYTLNNPIQYSDPSGHFPFLTAGIGAVVGEIVGIAVYTAYAGYRGYRQIKHFSKRKEILSCIVIKFHFCGLFLAWYLG